MPSKEPTAVGPTSEPSGDEAQVVGPITPRQRDWLLRIAFLAIAAAFVAVLVLGALASRRAVL
jgi:hypothetical protein